VSEFGTRRRRAYCAQKQVIEGLVRANRELQSERQKPADAPTTGILTGTSNVVRFFSTSRAWIHLLTGSLCTSLRSHANRDDRAVSVSVIDEN